MKKKQRRKNCPVSLEHPETWVRFHGRLCDDCSAGCCSLEVEVRLPDLVRMGLVDPFELEMPARLIARRLQKEGVVEHFNHKRQLFSLTRRASGDCIYLHPQTRRCTIYERRPDTCRNHPRVGPRPGFCAYRRQTPREVC